MTALNPVSMATEVKAAIVAAWLVVAAIRLQGYSSERSRTQSRTWAIFDNISMFVGVMCSIPVAVLCVEGITHEFLYMYHLPLRHFGSHIVEWIIGFSVCTGMYILYLLIRHYVLSAEPKQAA